MVKLSRKEVTDIRRAAHQRTQEARWRIYEAMVAELEKTATAHGVDVALRTESLDDALARALVHASAPLPLL